MSKKVEEQDLATTEAERQSPEESVEKEAEASEVERRSPEESIEEEAEASDGAKASVDEEPQPESEHSEETSKPVPPAKRRGNGVAWLALLLSLFAVAAIGYTVYQDWLAEEDTATGDAIARLEKQLADAGESSDELAARLAELGALDQSSSAEIDELRQELDERVRLLSSLPDRMSTLESSVASLAGISQSARDAWLIAEAEYYMQIANAQLQLANNPELATLALKMADERILQMANPALIDVRRAISDELAALEVMEKPDIAGATMTLASLAQVVGSLPLTSDATASDAEQAPAVDEQSGLSRAWSSMKTAMSGLVRVTPPDKAKLALVSPDAEAFLRSSLALQLQAARLALLRGEQAVFEQTLDDTSALLSQYFDSNSAQVASAQETLVEIRSNVFTSSAPDISGSLQLLRQFRVLRETSQ